MRKTCLTAIAVSLIIALSASQSMAGGLSGFMQGFTAQGMAIQNDPYHIQAERVQSTERAATAVNDLSQKKAEVETDLQQHLQRYNQLMAEYNAAK